MKTTAMNNATAMANPPIKAILELSTEETF